MIWIFSKQLCTAFAKIAITHDIRSFNSKEERNMAKRTRFAAACGAVLLVFALLFSVFFIVSEADHNCIGEDCPICHQIQTCQKLLEQLYAAHSTSGIGAVLCFFFLLAALRTQNIFTASSPVLWKVKLLN